jgi:hypothetical protein
MTELIVLYVLGAGLLGVGDLFREGRTRSRGLRAEFLLVARIILCRAGSELREVRH